MRKYLLVAAFSVSAILFGNVSAQADSPLLDFVGKYFASYNAEDFSAACGMLSPYKCDPKSAAGVERFSGEYKKMSHGYEDVSLWVPEIPEEQNYDIVCVKNSYQYKYSTDKNTITEVMSYYIKDRADGTKEITYRVCEEKMNSNGVETSCPVVSAVDYCTEEPSDAMVVEKEEMMDESLEEESMPESEMTEEAEAGEMESKVKTIDMLLEEIQALKDEIKKLEKEVSDRQEDIEVLNEEIDQDFEIDAQKAKEAAEMKAQEEEMKIAEEVKIEIEGNEKNKTIEDIKDSVGIDFTSPESTTIEWNTEDGIVSQENCSKMTALSVSKEEEKSVKEFIEKTLKMTVDPLNISAGTIVNFTGYKREAFISTVQTEIDPETNTQKLVLSWGELGENPMKEILEESETLAPLSDESEEEMMKEESSIEAEEVGESAKAEPTVTELEVNGMKLVITEYDEES